MRYSRWKVPRVASILETDHDQKNRQRHLITYDDGYIITPIPIDGSYFRGPLLSVNASSGGPWAYGREVRMSSPL